MTKNLIILVAVAVVVGVFFLWLFHVLARRERRAQWKKPKAQGSPSANGPLQISWRVAAVVLIVAVFLAGMAFLPWRNQTCAGRIVIRAGPRSAAPLECTCDGGRLGTCFPPGP
jgi:hypothetical protein